MTSGLLVVLPLLVMACSNAVERSAAATDTSQANQSPQSVGLPGSKGTTLSIANTPVPEFDTELPASLRELLQQPFTGDLDEMITRRMIRAGVPFDRTQYFVDNGVQRGVLYEALEQFETMLNRRLKTGNRRVHVIAVPLRRDLLFPALIEGRVDIVAAQLTVTADRRDLVGFSEPYRTGVNEVIITGPAAPTVASVNDLSGRDVFVRRSSSYFESLRVLNERFASEGRMPVSIREAPESFEDDDILEMVNAGLFDMTVVDDYLAELWLQVFTDIRIHKDVTLRTGGELAVAFRKHSPIVAAELNRFIASHRIGTEFGNTITRRYLRDTQFVTRATMEDGGQRFQELTDLFRKYGEQYMIDYLLMMAKGYQESRLNQNARSRVGAIGVMQLMPATGRAMNVGDIRQLEPNIHAGVKYTRQLMDDYLRNEPLDELNKFLFTLASYNAGPGRVRQLRREAPRLGLDPNIWLDNVEEVAAARIGRETVSYVGNIFKYYVAYRLVTEEEARRTTHKKTFTKQP
jgi:membrane-bound lytic murein transglycosylase MltF